MKITILDMQKFARDRGGECLSKEYIRGDCKLTWQCKEGHRWDATPHNIKKGRWCPICGWQMGTLEEMQKLAKKRGGKCLSKEYINNKTELAWQCKKGHRWDAMPTHIQQGSWCPICGWQMGTLEEMQKLAKKRGGKCLSKGYENRITKLTWQCKEGHRWDAMPTHIKRGQWCPICAGTAPGTLEEMQEIAKKRGGKCLSKKYINSRAKLTWQCKEGHRWDALPSSIKQGHWCRFCAGKNR